MNRNILISLVLAGTLLVGFYFYELKPHNLAATYCEEQYEYHPATLEQGAYHSAIGVSGPITKYESRDLALKMCTKYHKTFFRDVGEIESY